MERQYGFPFTRTGWPNEQRDSRLRGGGRRTGFARGVTLAVITHHRTTELPDSETTPMVVAEGHST